VSSHDQVRCQCGVQTVDVEHMKRIEER
jgi:hypothetical protein